MTLVDLTQPLGPETPLWPGASRFEATDTASVATDGYYERVISFPEHIGTHMDAPAHFAADGATVDEIPAERLVLDAYVFDACAAAAADPDFALDRSALDSFEADNGRIAAGSAVLLRTGWDARRHDRLRYYGGASAEDHRFPGFGLSAAERLVERGVVGIGTDTPSVDPGACAGFPVHGLTMAAGLWHLEGLVNLASLPCAGVRLFIGVLPLVGGSGAPARVIALAPDNGGPNV
ncbi:MAG: cyclase family protein [Solirubrobacterales bacterium]